MSGDEQSKPQIEINSDNDWKEKVKAEDARLDAEAASNEMSSENSTESESGQFQQLPEPSFFNVIQMFASQAVLAMGLIPGPDGKQVFELPLAKHFIDTLAMLEKKTVGNLDEQEAKFLDGTLHELRMTYVDISRRKAN